MQGKEEEGPLQHAKEKCLFPKVCFPWLSCDCSFMLKYRTSPYILDAEPREIYQFCLTHTHSICSLLGARHSTGFTRHKKMLQKTLISALEHFTKQQERENMHVDNQPLECTIYDHHCKRHPPCGSLPCVLWRETLLNLLGNRSRQDRLISCRIWFPYVMRTNETNTQ